MSFRSENVGTAYSVLSIFRGLRKIAKIDYLLRHVYPSFRPNESILTHLKDFQEVLYLNIFQKIFEIIQV